MKVSVIIVNYNGFADTCEVIESLKYQSVPVDVIVVDNASRVNEALLLEEKFPGMTFIRSETNLGFAGGTNLGIRHALQNRADYIMLLNNDTVADSQMVERLLRKADCKTVTAPAIYYADDSRDFWYGGGFVNKWTGNVCHTKLSNESFVGFASGCCFLAAASVFEEVGLLNESFFMYCEDAEFSIRLNRAGNKILYVPDAILQHKVGSSSGGEHSALSIYYTTRNRIRLIQSEPKWFYFTALPFTLLSRWIRYLQFRARKNKNAEMFIRGIHDGLHVEKVE